MTTEREFQNVFSIDVEEWFHLRRTEDYWPIERWGQLPARLPYALERILELLAETDNRATFFWLGWCAERYGQWVKRIAQAGHEIACHGYGHQALDRLTPEQFRAELRRTRTLLEDLAGRPVRGFRAPSLSLGTATAWMLEVLAEEGFAYDSSLLVTSLRFNRPARPPCPSTPAPHLLDGLEERLRDSRPWRWETAAGTIIELPISVRRCGPINLPFAGGLFFRIAPYRPVRATIRQFNAAGIPAVIYAHPWEFDPYSPTPPASTLERFSHRFRLTTGRRKYRRLLEEFCFTTAQQALADLELTQSRPSR